MGCWARARTREDRGAAAVEFALVAPLLLVLVVGIVSYGYMLSFRQGLSQAAAEGARAAAVAPASADRDALAEAAVESALGVACGSALLTCTTTAGPAGCAECLAVTVVYRYTADPTKPVFPGMDVALPDELTYTATVEMSE